MASPRGIMPDNLIVAERKADAIAWLRNAPIGPRLRSQLLRGWGVETGVALNQADYDALAPVTQP